MKKIITIIGSVVLVLGIALFVLGTMNILTLPDFSNPSAINGQNPTSNGSIFTSQTTILSTSDTALIKDYVASITSFTAIFPTQQDQVFNVSLNVRFTESDYNDGCKQNDICQVAFVQNQLLSPSDPPPQINIATQERTLWIPLLLSSGIQVSPTVPREYILIVESPQSFTLSYQVVARWQVLNLVGIFLALIGLLVTIFGVVSKPSGNGSKSLKARSWQEPTLGGSSKRSSSKSSIKSSKSSPSKDSGATSSARPSTAVNCKKCGGIMPRNSQYCPHCYTRQ